MTPRVHFQQAAASLGGKPQPIPVGDKGLPVAESCQIAVDTGGSGGIHKFATVSVIFFQFPQQVVFPAQVIFLVVVFGAIECLERPNFGVQVYPASGGFPGERCLSQSPLGFIMVEDDGLVLGRPQTGRIVIRPEMGQKRLVIDPFGREIDL